MKFIVGDIVRLKDEKENHLDYLNNINNIYKIVSIAGSCVKLSPSIIPIQQNDQPNRCGLQFNNIIEVDLSSITGVKIDSGEDKYIYYTPIIAASFECPSIPEQNTDYTHYLNAMVDSTHNLTMRDLISENGFIYVHEIQHYFREHYMADDLDISFWVQI